MFSVECCIESNGFQVVHSGVLSRHLRTCETIGIPFFASTVNHVPGSRPREVGWRAASAPIVLRGVFRIPNEGRRLQVEHANVERQHSVQRLLQLLTKHEAGHLPLLVRGHTEDVGRRRKRHFVRLQVEVHRLPSRVDPRVRPAGAEHGDAPREPPGEGSLDLALNGLTVGLHLSAEEI